MSTGLSQIGVRVVDAKTGNVPLLLTEIRHAVERLLDSGETHVIDLLALPLAPGEDKRIEQALGRGEASARVDALGPSEFQETAFAGVWLVTHFNAAGEIVGRFVEIAPVPEILQAPEADIRDGLRRLADALSGVNDAQ
ncbi:MAG: hydrogenase accessory protein HupE [Gammaproteobacteria bacterium]|nr:hydrogenase accessory protein HupE [Gammaproteobacteria bacterium]